MAVACSGLSDTARDCSKPQRRPPPRADPTRAEVTPTGSVPRVVVLPTTLRQPGYGTYQGHWVLLIEPITLIDASLVGCSGTQRVMYASEAKPVQTGDAEFNAKLRDAFSASAGAEKPS
jgi:hypothetical protein